MTPAIAEARLDELFEIAGTAPGLFPTAKRVYYRDVMQAIADGAEESPRLARTALRAESIGLIVLER